MTKTIAALALLLASGAPALADMQSVSIAAADTWTAVSGPGPARIFCPSTWFLFYHGTVAPTLPADGIRADGRSYNGVQIASAQYSGTEAMWVMIQSTDTQIGVFPVSCKVDR